MPITTDHRVNFPAMLNHLSFDWPLTTPEVRASINRAIESGDWGKYHGPFTDALVEKISHWLPADHVSLCCSGTIAVELALRGIGVQPGDEVILAAYDFPGNFRAIEAIGAIPVLVDLQPGRWIIDSQQIAATVSNRTRALIVSHLHGQSVDVAAVKDALAGVRASDRKIAIVEDVCQSPGGKLGGQLLGTNGDVAALSFGGSKLLSAGRGGAVTTNDPAIAQRIKVYSERGNDTFPLSQLQAAAVLPQLEQLDHHHRQRQQAADRLCQRINAIPGLATLSKQEFEAEGFAAQDLPAFYKIPIRIDDNTLNRDAMLHWLNTAGLPIGPGFRGFHRRSAKRCRRTGDLLHAKIAAQQTLLLHHPILLHDVDTLDMIATCLETAAKNHCPT